MAARASDEQTRAEPSPPESTTPDTESATASPPTEKVAQPDRHVDGGVKAWLQVLGAFFIYFNTWGLVASFGSFQAHYESDLLRNDTPFSISAIGSLQSFLMVFSGFVAGPVYDLGYSRQQLWLGSLLIVAGTVSQSFSHNLWQLLLSQGVCIGIGMGCLAILGVALPSLWFSKRLPLANGIAASGSGVGGLVLPIAFRNLQRDIGFRWAVLVIALIAAVTMGVAIFVLETPGRSGGRRALVDRSAFRDFPYLLFVAGCFSVFLGMYTPFVYIQTYAVDSGLIGPGFATYLLAILNAASILGRILPSMISHRVGVMNTIIVSIAVLCITALCLLAVKSGAGVVIVVVIYGFVSGTFFATQPTVFVRLTANRAYIGTRFGMAFTVMSVALLFGPPVAGALRREFGYNGAWIWAGVSLATATLVVGCSRGLAGGWGLKAKV